MDVESAKQLVIAEIERRADVLVEASHRIHENPELLFEEHRAADLLAGVCEAEGLEVERGAYGLPTAFAARAGSGDGPLVAILCEYDALPGLGHGCGHNIIAAAGLGAGLAAAAVARRAGGGRVLVLGTPGEEGGGGKILMAEHGAFADIDVALMVHPAAVDLTELTTIAVATWEVEYLGRAAHAAAAPWKGRNALDAAVLGYNAVAALRQHIEPSERVHGIFTKAGEKPNVVPDHAVAHWYVRSATMASLQPLKSRVLAALEGGAAAAGCEMRWRSTAPEYAELCTNQPLLELYRANAGRLGRTVQAVTLANAVMGSTDMGNVSWLVPSIHPLIGVGADDVPIHSTEFAQCAVAPDGDRAVLDGAKALAMTAVDIWFQPDALDAIRGAFPGRRPEVLTGTETAPDIRARSGREP